MFCFFLKSDEKITTRCPQRRVSLRYIPDGAEELSTQGLFCVWTETQNAQSSPFDLFSLDLFYFFFLQIHKKIERYHIWKHAGGKCCDETLSTIMGANHFADYCVCVDIIPTFKVPLISLFNVLMCFLQCVFSIQMQYNIESAIYAYRNCLHIFIRPWIRDCCS